MIDFQKNVNLKKYTTFGLNAEAKLFVEINSDLEFFELLNSQEWKDFPHFFLGKGANVLFTKDFEGIVVKVNILGKKVVQEVGNDIFIETGAGEDWNDFVLWTVGQGLGGIENLAGIPSSIGSAAFGNIGAYGMEAKDRIVSVQGIDLDTKKTLDYDFTDCCFEYRNSIFKQQLKDSFLITKVVFRLTKVDENYKFNTNYKDIELAIGGNMQNLTVEKLANLIVNIRNSKLPDWHILGTAGSFFKNPIITKPDFDLLLAKFPGLVSFPGSSTDNVKLSAGQLIELAGLKGYKYGNVGVYEKHALVLVNYGNGTGEELVELADLIQNKVFEMFGVSLEPEVIYV